MHLVQANERADGEEAYTQGEAQAGGELGGSFLHVVHGFLPVFDEASRVLILGSLPSAASRKAGFYYGHPRNRFWRVISCVLGHSGASHAPCMLHSIEEKRDFLLANHVALWDVVSSCDIRRSEDASIRNVSPNDLGCVISGAPIRKVLLNGGKAFSLYEKLCRSLYPLPCQRLPSTSAANAAYSFETLCRAWGEALAGFV